MVQWVEMWTTALDEVVQEDRAHDDDAFAVYLRWFLPRTRTRVTYVPRHPSTETAPVTQTYPRSRDVNFDYAVSYCIIFVTQLASCGVTNFNHFLSPKV